MAERPAIEEASRDSAAVPSLPPPTLPPPPRAFCVKCAADLTPLPPVARFCNRCGSPLSARFHQQHSASSEPPALAPPAPPSAQPAFRPPEILIAYARALFNLGCRYETALGSRRNLEEAARCYWKAARLSHVAAHNTPDPDAPPPFASVHRSYPS